MIKMLSCLIGVLSMSFTLVSYAPPINLADKIALSDEGSATEKVLVASGSFTGTLPCADCAGIQTRLTLLDVKVGKRKTFVLDQIYSGKPAKKNKLRIEGIWIPVRGNFQDHNAIIIQLIPHSNHDPIYFLKVNDSAIRMLNRKQDKIKSKHSYILKRT